MLTHTKRLGWSKIALSFWMQKGWMKYVSIKTGSYNDVTSYVIELFRERECMMNALVKMEIDLDEGRVEETTAHMKQRDGMEEIFETIDYELDYLNAAYPFEELYLPGNRYWNFHEFCYEEDCIPPGFYCKVEQIELAFDNGEDCAVYFYVDIPIGLNPIFEIFNDMLGLNTDIDDESIEMSLLSEEDIKNYNGEIIPVSEGMN